MQTNKRADIEFLNGNYETAREMYLDGARDGDALSAYNYAYCLLKGIGGTYEPQLAKSYFSFARDLAGGVSAYMLSMLYMHGEGVVRDFQKALEYMKLAADGGCIEAQLYLGMAYTIGCLYEPDIVSISMIPFHKSEYRENDPYLLMGDVLAAEEEEDMRFSVLRADARLAFEYFQRAARHDDTYVKELVAKGKFLYAKCYIDGLGVDFNRQKGARLMLNAGRAGSPDAVAFLNANGVPPELYLDKPKDR
jgi:TPR repeat protein